MTLKWSSGKGRHGPNKLHVEFISRLDLSVHRNVLHYLPDLLRKRERYRLPVGISAIVDVHLGQRQDLTQKLPRRACANMLSDLPRLRHMNRGTRLKVRNESHCVNEML